MIITSAVVLSDHTIWTQKAYINAGRSTPTREWKAQRLVLLIREMEKQERICHVAVIPYPAQGHINPMIQFSKQLASKGLQVTLVIFSSQTLSTPASLGSVKVVTVSDSSDTGSSSIGDLLKQFQATVAPKLPQLVVELGISSGHPVSCWKLSWLLLIKIDEEDCSKKDEEVAEILLKQLRRQLKPLFLFFCFYCYKTDCKSVLREMILIPKIKESVTWIKYKSKATELKRNKRKIQNFFIKLLCTFKLYFFYHILLLLQQNTRSQTWYQSSKLIPERGVDCEKEID